MQEKVKSKKGLDAVQAKVKNKKVKKEKVKQVWMQCKQTSKTVEEAVQEKVKKKKGLDAVQEKKRKS